MPEPAIRTAGARVAVEAAGEGIPVILAHGLTATRRYVVMGSRALERSGHRVIAYDARGHGESPPAATPGAYDYAELCDDLSAVLDARGVDRAVLAGASMGAHTILRLAMGAPERVAAIVAITPAYDPVDHEDPVRLARWDLLATALREGGVDGFLTAYGTETVPEAWRQIVTTVIRQRLARHAHPEAVADALQVVPRSRPFADLHALSAVECPAVVVASRDEADPGHPLDLARRYAELLPRGRLVVEDEGRSPLAWQGAQLSKVISELAAQAW